MNKSLKSGLKLVGAILVLGIVLVLIIRFTTKAHSPEDTVTYHKDDLKLEVYYNRPYKKKRTIFGELVPYNEVWRTGANEATTFDTNKDVLVDGSLLKAGKYTLWTIPMEDTWKIIFNDKMYPWGINLDEKAYRNPKFDALVLERPVKELPTTLEQFTILFEESGDFAYMVLAWDRTSVSVPIKKAEAPAGTSAISN
ncbi:DUF2911 domain-containing protein [Christiangramia crocea]|uniref:DUF2911 domain-containing protein n=1 Tax=Christiangramia crocea TaxID=2904124 RepID=A0A9X1UZ81_9FLAO|nr:DUF2911 domain-containing protein [Gramella crocea]MCG9972984.1 DUF2911 domain-containing protein [Gramella crocea]